MILVVGVVAVVGGLVWRARVRHARRADVSVALADPDPLVRARALQSITAVGLRPWAPQLLQQATALDEAREDTAAATQRAELAWLIAACQWEPADEPAIVQLRLWAKRYHTSSPAPRDAPVAARPVARAPVPPAPVPADDLRAAVEQVLGEPVLEVRSTPRPIRTVD